MPLQSHDAPNGTHKDSAGGSIRNIFQSLITEIALVKITIDFLVRFTDPISALKLPSSSEAFKMTDVSPLP